MQCAKESEILYTKISFYPLILSVLAGGLISNTRICNYMPETLRNALGRWLLDKLSLIAIIELVRRLVNTECGIGLE